MVVRFRWFYIDISEMFYLFIYLFILILKHKTLHIKHVFYNSGVYSKCSVFFPLYQSHLCVITVFMVF